MVNLLSLMKILESVAAFPYQPACLLRATGADVETFLQGQFTNDLSKLRTSGALYGLWLDRKGHVIGDSHVIRAKGPDEFWIASISSPAAAIERHLAAHIIADQVELADETSGWRGTSLIGPGAGDWLAGESRAGFVFPGRRTSVESWEWIYRDG